MVKLGEIIFGRYLWKEHTSFFFGYPQQSPDKFWDKRKYNFMMSHWRGRKGNCYKLMAMGSIKQFEKETTGRKAYRRDFNELCKARIEAGAAEHGYNSWFMREALQRSHIQLNAKVLANMSIFEPRTFRSIVAVAANKSSASPSEGGLGLPHNGPYTEIIFDGKV